MKRKLLAALSLLLLVVVPLLHHPGFAQSDDDDDPEQTQEEISLGHQATKQFERQVHVVSTGADVDRLHRILKRLVPVTGRKLPYTVKLVNLRDVNAVTFPGGFIYFFRGLMDLHPDDNELAGVMGHELAHAVCSHSYRKLEEMQVAGLVTGNDSVVGQLTQLLMVVGVGRTYENQADRLGVQYAWKAGYNPHGLLNMMETFKQLSRTEPGLIGHLLATHPPVDERIKRISAEIKTLHK